MKLAKIGVYLDADAAERRWAYGINVFGTYIGEILAHFGISFGWVDSAANLKAGHYDLIIIALAGEDQETLSAIWNFAEEGGIVISFAGLNRLAERLGCRAGREFGAGYAKLPAPLSSETEPLRFLRAVPWEVSTEDAGCAEFGTIHHNRPDGCTAGAALHRFQVGQGSIERWSVDIPYTVVCLQQGTRPVFEDGPSFPDGTAQVNDGILKVDDVIEMDWNWDRRTSPDGLPYFAFPYADLWREAFVSHLVRRALDAELTVPVLGFWPDGISQIALISLDSDHNIDIEAETALELLRECDIPTTWCMVEPGYHPSIYKQVVADGHELALHFNAVLNEDQEWSEESFGRQLRWLQRAAGLKENEIVSNKNHVTREEGWGELFRWCEKYGVASDQTRGASKRGNAGFSYGTCHAYFPIAWANEKNRLYDVVEIGFLLSDFNHMGTDIHLPVMERVKKSEGILHIIFHQTHLHTKEIDRQWLRSVVNAAKKQGFTFWTGRRINHWERFRRSVRITGIKENGDVTITHSAGRDSHRIVVWIPVPEDAPLLQKEPAAERFGVPCIRKVYETH
jgi:hypothetical protein